MLVQNTKRVVKAVATNQLARFAPGFYMRLTGKTGRGLADESSGQAAGYFRTCFDEYFAKLGVPPGDIQAYLTGKRILEYGPGDFPGVAILMIAHGAETVICVDRFSLLQLTKKNLAVLDDLLSGLSPEQRRRADECFARTGVTASGFNPGRIHYRTEPNCLSGLCEDVDLVISRAVLEHVNDLRATFADMHTAMRHGAVAIHQVDLKSHGLHLHNRLDFLAWPNVLWRPMYSHKGTPNRHRIDTYRILLSQTGFDIGLLEPTLLADISEVHDVRPKRASAFRDIPDADLRWLGFWLVCKRGAC